MRSVIIINHEPPRNANKRKRRVSRRDRERAGRGGEQKYQRSATPESSSSLSDRITIGSKKQLEKHLRSLRVVSVPSVSVRLLPLRITKATAVSTRGEAKDISTNI